MRHTLIIILTILNVWGINAQTTKKDSFLKGVYTDFLKYGTIYAAGDINNSYETTEKTYFLRTNPDGSLYSVPDVTDGTEYHPFDYRFGFGIRKLARFDYEVKGANFYTGATDAENNKALSAPTAAIDGFEYLFHWEKQRQRGDVFTNHRFFLRHTGKYHIVKAEARKMGNIDFAYQSVEARVRLPIGSKFSFSAGGILRTHKQAFGYNPIEIWLNEMDENGNYNNPWYTLGYDNGYQDQIITYTDNMGVVTQDWIWQDPDGVIVAYTDLQFRENIYPTLMNNYNNEIYSQLSKFGEVAPIIGADFYHYSKNFWIHAYANIILPFHQYVLGGGDFTYGDRNNWGKGGLLKGSEFEQWTDVQFGLVLGTKIGKHIGMFAEGEYAQLWDREIFQSSFGINYTFK